MMLSAIAVLGCNDDTTWNEPTFEIFRVDAVMRYPDMSYDQVVGAYDKNNNGNNPIVYVSRDVRSITLSIQIDSELYVDHQHIAIYNTSMHYIVGGIEYNDPPFAPGEITAAFNIKMYVKLCDECPETRFFSEDRYVIKLWMESVGGKESTYVDVDIEFVE